MTNYGEVLTYTRRAFSYRVQYVDKVYSVNDNENTGFACLFYFQLNILNKIEISLPYLTIYKIKCLLVSL